MGSLYFLVYNTMYFSSAPQNASLYNWIVKRLKDPIMQGDIVKYILLFTLICGPLIAMLFLIEL